MGQDSIVITAALTTLQLSTTETSFLKLARRISL